jgi:hypothetical protein
MHTLATLAFSRSTTAFVMAGLCAASLGAAQANAQEPAAPPAADDHELEAAWQQVLGTRPNHVEREVAAAHAGGLDETLPPAPPPTAPSGSGWRHELSIGGRQLSRADFENTPGDVERRSYEFGWSATVGAPANAWRFEYGFENHVYRFDGATGLLPATSSPVEGLFRHRFGAAKNFALAGAWTGYVSTGVDIGLEGSADIGDALMWRFGSGLQWRARDDLAWRFGLVAFDQLEDDALVVPFVGFDWDINARTNLSLGGSGLELSRDVGADTRAYGRVTYENRQFRLDDSGPNPEGSLEDSSFQVLVGLDVPVGIGEGSLSSARIDLFVGAQFGRELEFRTSDVEVGGDDVDPSALFGLRMRLWL